jgi:hypothetical protein
MSKVPVVRHAAHLTHRTIVLFLARYHHHSMHADIQEEQSCSRSRSILQERIVEGVGHDSGTSSNRHILFDIDLVQ